MNSVVLLASLLASAHGFASSPITGGVKCSANEEKFFVYSVDPSLVYPFVASLGGPDYTSNETVSRGLVGKTWQGVHMSITQANITITQASGKPLTVTSPNTLQTGGFNVLSENFCLGYGNWTVKLTAPTHPEMASYVNPAAVKQLTLEERRTPGAPINAVPVQPQALVDWAVTALNNVNVNNFSNSPMCKSDGTNCIVLAPFATRWAIFPAVMRAKAEAEAAKGPFGTWRSLRTTPTRRRRPPRARLITRRTLLSLLPSLWTHLWTPPVVAGCITKLDTGLPPGTTTRTHRIASIRSPFRVKYTWCPKDGCSTIACGGG